MFQRRSTNVVSEQRKGKEKLLHFLRECIPESTRWALRGGKDALPAWLSSERVKDLDIWLHCDDLEFVLPVLTQHAKGVISFESDPRWLRHVVLVMEDQYGGQLVDVSYGDLMVAGALTCPNEQVITREGDHGPMLDGVALVADVFLRKLLRGKRPTDAQMREVRSAWKDTVFEAKRQWCEDLRRVFGSRFIGRVLALLERGSPTSIDRVRLTSAAVWATLRQAGVGMMMRRRRRFVLAPKQRTLYKRPIAPVLVLSRYSQGVQEIAAMLINFGVKPLAHARNLRGWLHLINAALAGQTVIAARTEQLPPIGLASRLFGGVVTLDHTDIPLAQAEYLAAAHRWYIEKTDVGTARWRSS